MENGEWRMENGKWKMENGKWKMENGKWKMENGKWEMGNGECWSGDARTVSQLGVSDPVLRKSTARLRIANRDASLRMTNEMTAVILSGAAKAAQSKDLSSSLLRAK